MMLKKIESTELGDQTGDMQGLSDAGNIAPALGSTAPSSVLTETVSLST